MSTLRPSRALTHPLWWAALAVLVVNDHLFKGAGVLPQALVGKLSDVAGLLVAPAVLASLLRVRTRRGFVAAHLLTGLGFALINISPAAARAFEGLMAHTPWPWAIYVDPTDLLALPALVASVMVFAPWAARPVAVTPLLARAGVVLGAWASVATSPPPVPGPEPGVFGTTSARLMLANLGDATQLVRIRALRPEVRLDCGAIAGDPAALLGRALFGPANAWHLDAGRALDLEIDGAMAGPCAAWLVDGPNLAPRVVFFDAVDYPIVPLSLNAAAVRSERSLRFDDLGWARHDALWPMRRAAPELPPPECRLPPVGAGVAWTPPPARSMTLRRIMTAPDGCSRLEAEVGAPWYLCLGDTPLPFAAGEQLVVLDATAESLVIEGPQHTVQLFAGTQLTASLIDVVDQRPDRDCPGTENACGGFGLPLSVQFIERDSGTRRWLRTGARADFEFTEVSLVRAEQPLVADGACGTPGLAPHLEFVAVFRR